MIVRLHDPSEIVQNVTDGDHGDISYIRLLSLTGEIDVLMGWGYGIPVDLVVSDPCRDLPFLYRYAPVLEVHPIRVSVPLVPGFGKVVKLAISLGFAVKVEGGQPEESLSAELQQISRFYLHHSTVSEPVEFFHILFLACYHQDPLTLWIIQEEDPSLIRSITDRGEETLPGRLAGEGDIQGLAAFLQALRDGTAVEPGECAGCVFLRQCLGYFKWPRKEYRCDVVKELLHTLYSAAEELRADMALLDAPGGGEGR